MKNYKFGFNLWGLLLFAAIMLPNIIWFIVPAPDDVLRAESVTEAIDVTASVSQVLMIAALCVIINKTVKKIRLSPLIIAAIVCCLLYYACWVLYYIGIVNVMIILGLTAPPCLAFLLFAADRRNYIAIIPALIFTVCHLIFGIVNFC